MTPSDYERNDPTLDTPEYGFGGAAYARARKLKQKEMQAQAWHDANVAPVGRIFPADKDDEIANAREVLSAYDQLVDNLREEFSPCAPALLIWIELQRRNWLVARKSAINLPPAWRRWKWRSRGS